MLYLADTKTGKRPAYNERFGATAAGRADLKGSAGMPPLRQAATTLCDTRGRQCVLEKFQTKEKYLLKFDYLCDLIKRVKNE